ncbi:MAG: L-serine ammonia-lyase, iron-sulfur-dependent, subunit alpha [Thermoguttaceae bacterium]|jgi:L-serine dehydratase
MRAVSILNHVLGPVMRGPSSSHTAGAFHIACMARSILGGAPRRAALAFDPAGSYSVTYAAQGADRGFAMGLLGKPLTDESFFTALGDAPQAGMEISFEVRKLAQPDHPNTVEMALTAADGSTLRLAARSIGGGEVQITSLNGRPVRFNGAAYETLLEVSADTAGAAGGLLAGDGQVLESTIDSGENGRVRLTARRKAALPATFRGELRARDPSARVWESTPVYFVQAGQPQFSSAAEMVQRAERLGLSLGRLALAYEAQLLGISPADVMAEMLRRYDIMARSVQSGLDPNFTGLQLLPACAGAIFQAEAESRLSARSPHTRAAARALAVMHVNAAMGVVCAAPTGGSAGVIPAVLVTLAEERSLTREQIGLALLAAGAVGTILAIRGTFAAEVAGCQVEIGASGAMAAAAVVDAVGGTARQACDAAAISFQNTMGSVCDLVQGMVEIPCHTRNAAAAAGAFVNADLGLGGYTNFIPLDETIDAVYAVGLAMPAELRCTSKGGLAVAPSARALKPGGCGAPCASRKLP